MDFDLGLDILTNLANNRLAPVPEEQTEDLFRAIEFSPMICKQIYIKKFIQILIKLIKNFFSKTASIDTSAMQDIMSANQQAQQRVIQSNTAMNVDQQQNDQVSNNNQLMFTATIFAAPNMSQASEQQVMAMQQNRANDSNSQTLMSDLNPFLTGTIDITQQVQSTPTVEQLLSPSTEDDDKDTYKGKFSRMSQWKAQLPKREPHNYDKCQPTAHQTTIYNQILAQQQEAPPATAAPNFNNNPYMTDVATVNISHMPSNQGNTNSYSNSSNGQNALNLSNSQMYGNKMMNYQSQQVDKNYFLNLKAKIIFSYN